MRVKKYRNAATFALPALRKRVCHYPLRGTDPLVLHALRTRLKRNSGGRAFVYRTSEASPEIVISNHEIEGRADLVAVYDASVTTAMLRQDLYGEEPDDIDAAEWGERRVA